VLDAVTKENKVLLFSLAANPNTADQEEGTTADDEKAVKTTLAMTFVLSANNRFDDYRRELTTC
jgi:hypothetical protein